ncbi:MAG: hypothetical protein L3J71_17000 [Victivallaceae bacterium]|nr:hypothetical protein [Victivallaceae bacterium]
MQKYYKYIIIVIVVIGGIVFIPKQEHSWETEFKKYKQHHELLLKKTDKIII